MIDGVVAAIRAPSPAVRSGVQHIAAGVLFAALATELLPDVVHRRMPFVTLIGFALGVAAMLLLRQLAARLEASNGDAAPRGVPTSLLLVSGVDIALDGVLIGISFAAGARQGLLITVALTLEVLFLGVATAAAMSGPGVRQRVVLTTLAFAALLLAGAGIGAYFLAGVDGVILDAVMSFGVAALLYLVTEELLVEAHEVDETPLLTSMFFVGIDALHDIHTATNDVLRGYREMSARAEPEIQSVIRRLTDLHERHAAEQSAELARLRDTGKDDSSLQGTVNKVVVMLRDWLTHLDRDVLPAVREGEEALRKQYDKALDEEQVAANPSVAGLLRTQLASINVEIARLPQS